MRLKLPWRKSRDLAAVGLYSAVDTQADWHNQEMVRGAEMLQHHQVETAELGDLAKLPPFRPVAIRLIRLFDQTDVRMDEVSALVESDPSMASEMLAIVNSALFGVQQTVSSPAHAITLLGVDRTKSLAATLAMRSMMQGGPRTPIVRRFWIHSIATATIARHIARLFEIAPEQAHVAGLLHDLGRCGILAAHREEYAHLAIAAHESTAAILAQEQATFGMTHCLAGALLAQAWSLPDTLREVVGRHHETTSRNPIVTLVQLCCRLADDFMYQSIHRTDIRKPEETIQQCAPEALRAPLIGELEAVSAAIDTAIKTLDF